MSLAYRREIDGLRAVAVAAVVLHHAGFVVAAGYAGVDVFFVISGYLITALLLREQAATGAIDLRDFYARRVRRIVPALVPVVLATLAAGQLLLDSHELMALADSAVAAALFVANLFFLHRADGYFQEASATLPLLHLWSLSVEEQFYLAWPLLLLGLLRLRLPLAWAIGALALASFRAADALLPEAQASAFYQTPPRFWELAAGGLVAALPARRLPTWAGWLGLLVVADAMLVPMHPFPGRGALPAVAGTALLLAVVHGGGGNRLLASAPFVGLGLVSYSLYLWHWPLLAFYRVLGGSDAGTRAALCGVALLLAIGSYRYVEQPFRRWRWPSRATLVAGFAAIACMALGGFAMERLERRSPGAIAARDMPSGPGICHDTDPARCLRPANVAIWGDSMAFAWHPLADAIGPAVAYSKNGCKAVVGYDNPTRPDCRRWAESVLPYVRELDTLVIAGRWEFEFFERDRAGGEAAMRRTLAQLRKVRRVVLVGPLPTLRDRAPNCLEGNDLARCAVTRKEYRRRTDADRSSLRTLAAEFPNVEYLEAGDWFCAVQCPATRGGMVLYYDRFHVSRTAARAFAAEHLPALKDAARAGGRQGAAASR